MKDIEFLKALFAVAWADKKLSRAEQKLLSQLRKGFTLTRAETRMAKEWETNPVPFSELKMLDFSGASDSQKRYLLLLAFSIAHTDGVTGGEKRFLEALRVSLGLRKTTYEELVTDVLASLQKYAFASH